MSSASSASGLRIYHLLVKVDRPMTATEITEALDLVYRTVSRHLELLGASGYARPVGWGGQRGNAVHWQAVPLDEVPLQFRLTPSKASSPSSDGCIGCGAPVRNGARRCKWCR